MTHGQMADMNTITQLSHSNHAGRNAHHHTRSTDAQHTRSTHAYSFSCFFFFSFVCLFPPAPHSAFSFYIFIVLFEGGGREVGGRREDGRMGGWEDGRMGGREDGRMGGRRGTLYYVSNTSYIAVCYKIDSCSAIIHEVVSLACHCGIIPATLVASGRLLLLLFFPFFHVSLDKSLLLLLLLTIFLVVLVLRRVIIILVVVEAWLPHATVHFQIRFFVLLFSFPLLHHPDWCMYIAGIIHH